VPGNSIGVYDITRNRHFLAQHHRNFTRPDVVVIRHSVWFAWLDLFRPGGVLALGLRGGPIAPMCRVSSPRTAPASSAAAFVPHLLQEPEYPVGPLHVLLVRTHGSAGSSSSMILGNFDSSSLLQGFDQLRHGLKVRIADILARRQLACDSPGRVEQPGDRSANRRTPPTTGHTDSMHPRQAPRSDSVRFSRRLTIR